MNKSNIRTNLKNVALSFAFIATFSVTLTAFAQIAQANAPATTPLFVQHYDTQKQAIDGSTVLLNRYRGHEGACTTVYRVDEDHHRSDFEVQGFRGKHSCFYDNTNKKRGVANVEVD